MTVSINTRVAGGATGGSGGVTDGNKGGVTVSGSGTVWTLNSSIQISATDSIPFDTYEPGKWIPEQYVTADKVILRGAGTLEGATCLAYYKLDGTHTIDFSNVNVTSGASFLTSNLLSGTANDVYAVLFTYLDGTFQAGINYLGSKTPPTLVSATFADATPTHCDVVFSKAMNSTWSAFGSIAIGGRTVTAFTRTGATTGYATVSVAAVYGGSYTIDYTQPGTNNMQDLAGNLLANFSGTAITNNVASAYTLNYSTPSLPGSAVLTATDGTNNWMATDSGAASPVITDSKLSPAFGVITYAEAGNPTVFGTSTGYAGYTTDGSDNSSSAVRSAYNSSRAFGGAAAGTPITWTAGIPVTTAARIIDVYIYANTPEAVSVSMVLGDASASVSPYTGFSFNGGAMTLLRINCGPATTTSLTVTYTDPNVGGAGFVCAPIIMVR